MANRFVLGIDLGIASCGYALVNLDEKKIATIGVRCFERAENPKTGASLALPRREKRLLRRVTRRRRQRIRKIWALGVKHGLISAGTREKLQNLKSPWQLRKDALTRILDGDELMRVLLHIAKRRGFKSSKRADSTADDSKGRLLEGTAGLRDALMASGCRTIGEYLADQPRQRNGNDEYVRTVLRSLLEEEVKLIFASQATLQSKFTSKEFLVEYLAIAFKQKPLQSTEKMVGWCQFEKGEKRAPRASYSSERARLLQSINHLRIITINGDEFELDADQRNLIVEYAYKSPKITYKQLRNKLELTEDIKFSNLLYPAKTSAEYKDPENATFIELKGFHSLRKALKGEFSQQWEIISKKPALLDQIIWVLTVEKDDFIVANKLQELGLQSDIAAKLGEVSFSGHAALSLIVLRKITPFLEVGDSYSSALEKAGYGPSTTRVGKRYTKLPPIKSAISNPVVSRALSQARKVVNAIVREFGVPDRIHVELARDISRSFQERTKIKKEQDTRSAYRQDRIDQFKETFGRAPIEGEFDRFLLWHEQAQVCPYCQKRIEVSEAMDPTTTQVDHILPFSRSFDDSFANRVLVHTHENQAKKEQTPFEYIGSVNEDLWLQFCAAINHFPPQKKRRLMLKNFAEAENKWKERHLNDTRYITREFTNFLREYLAFPDDEKEHVFARNGQITSALRYFWGLKKERSAGDTHHALDALVVAISTNEQVNRLTHWSQARERGQHWGQQKTERYFPLPWDTFRNDAQEALANVFVSRMPHRKGSGAAHDDTIRSIRKRSDGTEVVVQRIKLGDLSPAQLESLWDKERNIVVHKLLSARFEKFGANPKIAFKDPVYMPNRNPNTIGPVINSVLIETNHKSGIKIRGASVRRSGLASNGNMVRVDVFEKATQYFLVPIYIADLTKPALPLKYVKNGVNEKLWSEVDSTFEFRFSLYPNDYVVIQKKNDKQLEGYYRTMDRSTASISILSHDGSLETRGIGVLQLKVFNKYAVDLLGRRFLISREERHGLANPGNRKSSAVKRKSGTIAGSTTDL